MHCEPMQTALTAVPVCCCLYISKKPLLSQASTRIESAPLLHVMVLHEPLFASLVMVPPRHVTGIVITLVKHVFPSGDEGDEHTEPSSTWPSQSLSLESQVSMLGVHEWLLRGGNEARLRPMPTPSARTGNAWWYTPKHAVQSKVFVVVL